MVQARFREVRRAGIADFHQHDLRHTAASYLQMSGVDLRTLAEIFGKGQREQDNTLES